jgi:hypothetical protein
MLKRSEAAPAFHPDQASPFDRLLRRSHCPPGIEIIPQPPAHRQKPIARPVGNGQMRKSRAARGPDKVPPSGRRRQQCPPGPQANASRNRSVPDCTPCGGVGMTQPGAPRLPGQDAELCTAPCAWAIMRTQVKQPELPVCHHASSPIRRAALTGAVCSGTSPFGA